jgi:hypothetical protein
VWCRRTISSSTGTIRIDAVPPDGSDRRTEAGAGATAISPDAGFLDRFDVISVPQGADGIKSSLLLFDIDTRNATTVAPDFGTAMIRAGILWWSTGDGPNRPPAPLGSPGVIIDRGVANGTRWIGTPPTPAVPPTRRCLSASRHHRRKRPAGAG